MPKVYIAFEINVPELKDLPDGDEVAYINEIAADAKEWFEMFIQIENKWKSVTNVFTGNWEYPNENKI